MLRYERSFGMLRRIDSAGKSSGWARKSGNSERTLETSRLRLEDRVINVLGGVAKGVQMSWA